MKRHEWRKRHESGEWLYLRAQRHAGEWQLLARLKSEEEFTPREGFSLGEMHELRDILWRKYQRRRLPWEIIEELDKSIEDREEEESETTEGAETNAEGNE